MFLTFRWKDSGVVIVHIEGTSSFCYCWLKHKAKKSPRTSRSPDAVPCRLLTISQQWRHSDPYPSLSPSCCLSTARSCLTLDVLGSVAVAVAVTVAFAVARPYKP